MPTAFRPPSFLTRPFSIPRPATKPAPGSDPTATEKKRSGKSSKFAASGHDEPPRKKRRVSPPTDEVERSEPDDRAEEGVVEAAAISATAPRAAVFRLPSSSSQSGPGAGAGAATQRSGGGFRTPLVSVVRDGNGSGDSSGGLVGDGGVEKSGKGGPRRVFSVLWRKITTKKHKTWDGDGTLVLADGYASIKSDKGRYMGRTSCKTDLGPGDTLVMAGMDVEIDGELKNAPLASSQMAESNGSAAPASTKSVPAGKPRAANANISLLSHTLPRPAASSLQQVVAAKPKPFKAVVQPQAMPGATGNGPTPKHDPDAEGALVMKRPAKLPPGKQIVDVVVDPFLCRKLREHQREGVAFIYECIMGMRCTEVSGAILADEMGLGKTLQTIALIWTLLKQNPIHGEGPAVRKAVIICPASVTNNWKKEFKKWLGNERIGVLTLDDQRKISRFVRGKSYQVLVVSYEMFNLVQQDLQRCEEIDLIVADEGHRLKKAKSKTVAAINSVNCERRLVLTGTLLQNDYSEWYCVVDFVNPGFLGKYSSFKRDYEIPILRARQQDASLDDIEKGDEAFHDLKAQTAAFILRRTADILSKYLPPKTEYVLFCRPTDTQVSTYNAILTSGTLSAAMRAPELAFQLMMVLKKTCNAPALLTVKTDKGNTEDAAPSTILDELLTVIPKLATLRTSGKSRVLDSLLHHIHSTTDEKVVIMSNYTTTLDLIARLLEGLSYTYLRLDGSTPTAKRQELVDKFNRTPANKLFIFLMSTKAGGVGLNLIGASRLILYDIDWNPALDQQAMARTHRDGQKRPCFIYRLVTKGAIEERIFQRQVVKTDLAGQVVDDKTGTKSSFSQEELRDLFRLDVEPGCRSHELVGCPCGGMGRLAGESHDNDQVNQDQDKGDGDDDDEDELDEPIRRPGRDFVSASQVQRSRSRTASPEKKDKKSLAGLMVYEHVDAVKYRAAHAEKKYDGHAGVRDGDSDENENMSDASDDVETVRRQDEDLRASEQSESSKELIDDAILRAVVLEDHSSVEYIFAKTNAEASVTEEVVVKEELAAGEGK